MKVTTRDNVTEDVSAVAHFRVVDAVKSVVAIEDVGAAIDQIAPATRRKEAGQQTLDQARPETDKINLNTRKILDVSAVERGVGVTLVQPQDIQLPDSTKRAMARQAQAARETRAKVISAESKPLAAAELPAALPAAAVVAPAASAPPPTADGSSPAPARGAANG